jgi:hypothetical protein
MLAVRCALRAFAALVTVFVAWAPSSARPQKAVKHHAGLAAITFVKERMK